MRLRLLRAVGLLLVFGGCNQIADIYEGELRECAEARDCDQGVPSCRSVRCEAGACIYEDKPEGTLIEPQAPGDCLEVQCDGQGRTRQVIVSSDNDDGKPCTLDECIGSTPRHTVMPAIACYSGTAVTRNRGVCKDGVQACDALGDPVGPCVGEVLPKDETCASIYDDDCDGEVNEADGLLCQCASGTFRECYGGPVSSLGVGPCASGYQECMQGLVWGPCMLQVLPQIEACSTVLDDDCDGQINESGADCSCGDGFSSNNEKCDDGNSMDGDGCSSACVIPLCGNGTQDAGEECDDGNLVDIDECTTTCKLAKCGDGVVQIGVESCDDGNTNEIDGCTSQCLPSSCGNGVIEVELGELCDDGNYVGGDGCQEDCKPSPIALAAGNLFTCALFVGGAVKCWGENYSGQLGQGDYEHRGNQPGEMGSALPAIKLGTNRKAIAIAAGEVHTCAILDDGSVKCWGNNDDGRLGQDDITYRNRPDDSLPPVNLKGVKAKAIGAGGSHTCVVLEDGSVKCWGKNHVGQLGIGSKMNWGDKLGDMDALPTVPLTPGTKATALSLGYDHTCVLQDDSRIRCWGNGSSGQLGHGGMDNRGDDPGEAGGVVIALSSGQVPGALATTLGNSFCARFDDGKLGCWGSNGYCQLGFGNYATIGDNEVVTSAPIVNMGSNQQALNLLLVNSAVSERHQCAALSSGGIRCWGDNTHGQLGIERNCEDTGDQVPLVDLGSGFFAAQVVVGAAHSCALSTSGRVKCWGHNAIGELGLGDSDQTPERGKDPAKMGNGLPPIDLW